MLSMDGSWVPALIIGSVTFYLLKYLIDVKSLPPGPLPLPLVGNVLLLWRNKKNPFRLFEELKDKYRGMYTLWFGSVPMVFVADCRLIKEGLLTKRNDIISRPQFKSLRHSLEHTDAIVFQGNNKQWEVCRKVGHIAIRKFADAEVLATIIRLNTETMIAKMMAKTEPFNPKDEIQETVFSIISQTAFGYEKLSESELILFKQQNDLFHETMTISPGDFSPLLAPFFRNLETRIRVGAENTGRFLKEKFYFAKQGYKSGELRHFADSVMSSGIEAEKEESENKDYLTDHHLRKILGDLFLAGTDTTSISLTWIFLALATFPEIQEKIRNEIDVNIGADFPLQERKKDCPYTWAFISEILRVRPPVPMLIPHATDADTSLGGVKIPKGTAVIFDINATHFDPDIWEEPLKFKPERFLDSAGNYSSKKLTGYLPFGEGKRMCIGEKMARNDLFLVIANVLRKATVIYHAPEIIREMARENNPIINIAADFQIKLVPRIDASIQSKLETFKEIK